MSPGMINETWRLVRFHKQTCKHYERGQQKDF